MLQVKCFAGCSRDRNTHFSDLITHTNNTILSFVYAKYLAKQQNMKPCDLPAPKYRQNGGVDPVMSGRVRKKY